MRPYHFDSVANLGSARLTIPEPRTTEMKNKITTEDERASQLADITTTGDDDNVECAAADLFREFQPTP